MKSANPGHRLDVHSGKGFRRRSRSWFIRRRRCGGTISTSVRGLYLRRHRAAGTLIIAIVALTILVFYAVR